MGKKFNNQTKFNKKKGYISKPRDYRKDSDSKACDKEEVYVSTGMDGAKGKRRSINIKAGNDINFWNKSPLFDDATRVPFAYIPGTGIQLSYNTGAVADTEATKFKVPGIMSIDFQPLLGTVKDSNSPANRAFTSLFTDMQSRISGELPFTQASLAFFMCSFSSVAVNIAHVMRALEWSFKYEGDNYYEPHTILRAMGYNPTLIIGHQDELRMRINDCIESFNKLYVPDFMSIYDRQFNLVRFVYLDDEGDERYGQKYVFNPSIYYQYSDVDNELTAFETPLSYAEGGADINSMIDAIEDQLTAWRNSSDLGKIAGNIKRAFSDAQIVGIPFMTGFERPVPMYREEINWQIMNSLCGAFELESLSITEDVVNNVIVSQPVVALDAAGSNDWAFKPRRHILNSYNGVTDSSFVMEATRLMPVPYSDVANKTLTAWNTEAVYSYTIWTRLDNGTINYTTVYSNYFENLSVANKMSNTELTKETIEFMAKATQFQHAPRFYIIDVVTGVIDRLDVFGEVDTVTTVDDEVLRGINRAAIQSVYTVDPGKIALQNL